MLTGLVLEVSPLHLKLYIPLLPYLPDPARRVSVADLAPARPAPEEGRPGGAGAGPPQGLTLEFPEVLRSPRPRPRLRRAAASSALSMVRVRAGPSRPPPTWPPRGLPTKAAAAAAARGVAPPPVAWRHRGVAPPEAWRHPWRGVSTASEHRGVA